MVPDLKTALSGPLLAIERHLMQQQNDTESWFRAQWQQTPAPFYASVDLRNAGFKLAPVDTNLFPAGFNNLAQPFLPLCIQAVQQMLERECPGACRILLIPENHTRNQGYLRNLHTLYRILTQAGYETRIGTTDTECTKPFLIEVPDAGTLTLEPIQKTDQRLHLTDFDPCIILLNHDLSGGLPSLLQNVKQRIMPPVTLGWWQRRKSEHFRHYHNVVQEFCDHIGLDPWLLCPLSTQCDQLDFMKREGQECLAQQTDQLLARIQAKYTEHNIEQTPFVVVKADSGTYGMGIMTAHSGDELLALNRKQRTRMASAKGGGGVSSVLIQEGVYTFERLDDAVAEPVVYLMDHFVVGGFYRVHKNRGINENLNAPGMHFEPLAFSSDCISPDPAENPDAEFNRFYAYGIVAKLAVLAAARELAAAAH